jgi:beta-glucanase (GH16 family)
MRASTVPAPEPPRAANVRALAVEACPPPSDNPYDEDDAWTVVWSDEFDASDGARPDATKWTMREGGGGWGNEELEIYTARAENAFVRGGALHLVARREADGRITSARLDTQGKFAFTHGRVEARLRLPAGAGLWPAFWMLGSEFGRDGAWPACGEIDILELIGKEPTRIHGTLHAPGDASDEGTTAVLDRAAGFADDFHRYGIEWEAGAVRFLFDGEVYATRTEADLGGRPWTFDHDFFLLLNLAVGGSWPGPPDATTPWPSEVVVDWVRISKRGR